MPSAMTGDEAPQANLETILLPGQIVGGKYRVDYLIAQGGMAAVWAGTNQRTGKRVALKVVLRSFAATADAHELFRREALAASRVNHPNVVNVFDVIDHEGMSCVVMELLTGEPLSTYLARKGFLSTEEAVALLLPAMRGVAAANAQGVVHRDLKPQNVFICIGSDGRILTTKILDFGIAVVVEKAVDKELSTAPVTLIGTPSYMSPEHVAGQTDIDERADVYGFGVILFEALTGHLPFPGEPTPTLFVRILSQDPPRVTEYRPDLQPAIANIIERALAKSPEDRFPTLNHLISELEQVVLNRSPLPRSLTPMVGVALLESGSGPSGVADSVVQVSRQGGSAGGRAAKPTQALFLLPPLAKPVAVPAPRPITRSVARSLLAASAFAGVLALTIWLALPRHPDRAAAGLRAPLPVAGASPAPPQPSATVVPSSGLPSLAMPAAAVSAPPSQPALAVPTSAPTSADVPSFSVREDKAPSSGIQPASEPVAKRRAPRASLGRTIASRGRILSREDQGDSFSPAPFSDRGLPTDLGVAKSASEKLGPTAAARAGADARNGETPNSEATQASGDSGSASTHLSTWRTSQTRAKAGTLSAEDF
jgi:eukaryotic-like serine/threonine-protein kinase